jgi:hypothetical protein
MFRLRRKPSRLLAMILTSAHVGGASALPALDIPLWAKISVAGALAISAFRSVRRALLLTSDSVIALELRRDGGASIQTRTGACCEARILSSSYVTPMMTIINLKESRKLETSAVVLLSDSASAEELRQVRVLLRWSHPPGRSK